MKRVAAPILSLILLGAAPETPQAPPPAPDQPTLQTEVELVTADVAGDHVVGHEMGWKGSVLVDGFGAGAWRVRRARKVATMTVELFGPITAARRDAVE